jgi:hypothetical protein
MTSHQHRLSRPLKRPAVRTTGMVLQGMLSSKAFCRCHSASKRISGSGSPREQTQRRIWKNRAAGIKLHGGLPRHLILHRWTSNCTNGTSSGGPQQAATRSVTAESSTDVRTFHLPSSARRLRVGVRDATRLLNSLVPSCIASGVLYQLYGDSACCFIDAFCCCGDMAMIWRTCFALQPN